MRNWPNFFVWFYILLDKTLKMEQDILQEAIMSNEALAQDEINQIITGINANEAEN
jgi:hypothetical protein